jgi:hypothetical protein
MIQLNKKYQSCGKKYIRFNPKTNIYVRGRPNSLLTLTAYHKVGRPLGDIIWMNEKSENHWDRAYVDQFAPDYGRDLVSDYTYTLTRIDTDRPESDSDTESNQVQQGTTSIELQGLPPSAKVDDAIERMVPIQVLPIPNPHIDKELLTKEQLRDVLAWAIEQSVGGDYPKIVLDQLATTPIVGQPQTAIEKLTALLGELVYGKNNYIGPSKTGLVDDKLENVVTVVPALSEQDARARAHDIALTVNSDQVHDQILTGVARTAQVARPYIQTPTDRLTALRTRYRHTNQSELTKDGDVEGNPGPIYRLTAADSADDAIKIVSDPTSATSYLNDSGTDWRVDEMAYNTMKGVWAMRHGLDNQSDYVTLDDNYMQYLELSFNDLAGVTPGTSFFGAAFFSYAINNKEVKATLTNGDLGTAITTALNNIDTFTAMQRTQTNSINGDALINIFQRAPKTDYGCYLPIAKLLAYEMSKGPLSGQETLPFVFDHMYRANPNQAPAIVTSLYPGSDNHNWAAPAPGVTIDSYYITPSTAARLMTGAVPMPAGWGLDSRDIAWVVCTGNLSRQTLSYYTICHLEYPFFGINDNIQRVFPTAAGGAPALSGSTSQPAPYFGNVIQGHKYRVMFVSLTEPINDLGIGSVAAGVNITEWTGVGAPPAATDIFPALRLFIDNDWRGVFGGVTPWFSEALQYMFKFADKHDWRAAMWLASSMMGFKDYGIYGVDNAAATSPTIIRVGTNVAPTIDATVATRDTNALSAANRALLADVYQRLPKWNMSGMPSQRVPATAPPAAGGSTPRVVNYISCLVQDTAWLTKLAIGMNMFTKDVLAKSDVEKLLKLKLKNLYFAHRHLSSIGFQMTHNFFQDIGCTRRMVHLVGNVVLDRRLMIYQKLYSDFATFFKNYAGWKFMRPQYPTPPVVQPTGAGALQPYWNRDAWLDSPVYLFDHTVFINEAKQYYGFVPEVNYTLLDKAKYALEPGQADLLQYYSINTGGNSTVRARWHESVTAPTATSTRWKPEYKCAFAQTKAVSLLNPAHIISLGSVFCITIHGMTPFHVRPALTNSLGWLRWTATTAPSDTFRVAARQFLIWTLPCYPPEQDTTTGQHFALAGGSQSDFASVKLGYNLQGRGSSNYGLVQNLTAIDGDLVVTENPF